MIRGGEVVVGGSACDGRGGSFRKVGGRESPHVWRGTDEGNRSWRTQSLHDCQEMQS